MLFASCNSRFGNEVSVLQNTKRDAAIDRGCELPPFEMSSFAAVCDSVQKEVVGQAILSFGMLRLSVLDRLEIAQVQQRKRSYLFPWKWRTEVGMRVCAKERSPVPIFEAEPTRVLQ